MTREELGCDHVWAKRTTRTVRYYNYPNRKKALKYTTVAYFINGQYCRECLVSRLDWENFLFDMCDFSTKADYPPPSTMLTEEQMGLTSNVDNYIQDGLLTELALGLVPNAQQTSDDHLYIIGHA